MIPIALAVTGVTAVIAGLVVLARSPGFRIGRTLAGAHEVSIEQALVLAASAVPRFVRVHGRIISDEEFPDENDRPLVYRRKRIELRDANGNWRNAASETESVQFGIESRTDHIGVDGAQLATGLVVIPRVSEGKVADLPAEFADGADPQARARLVIEQVSAVEHAWVAGVPRLDRNDGSRPVMSAGLGRPLIVTTLDIPDAMRVLGTGRRMSIVVSVGLVVLGVLLAAGAAIAMLVGAGSQT